MCVVSYHLSTNVYTRMPLAELSRIKRMIGLKPVSHTKVFVSSVKALYQEEMQLVLPLPMKRDRTCKKMKREHRNHSWIRKWVKNESR